MLITAAAICPAYAEDYWSKAKKYEDMENIVRTETRSTIGDERDQRIMDFEVAMQAVDLGLATMEEAGAACREGRIPMEWLQLLAEVSSDKA